MTSLIDVTKPTAGNALTVDVRANFAAAKSEIEALQGGVAGGPFLSLQGGIMDGPITLEADAIAPLQPVTLQQSQAASGAINVKDKGAKGDGVTDDTAIIRAAVALGGDVYFPLGTYIVSGDPIVIPNRTHIHAAGSALSIIKPTTINPIWSVPTVFCNELYTNPGPFAAGSTTPALQTDHDITIEDLGFDAFSQEPATLRFQFVTGLRFRNLRFFNSQTPRTHGSGGIGLIGCDDIVISQCKFDQSTNPIDCWQGVTRIKIDNCVIESFDNGSAANGGMINFNGGGTVQPQTQSSNDLQVSNSTFWLRNSMAALLDSFGAGCSSHTIMFVNCRFHAKAGTANNSGIIGRGLGDDVKIQNCTFSADPGLTIPTPILIGGFYDHTAPYVGSGIVSTTAGSPDFTVSVPNGTALGPGNYCSIDNNAGGPLVGNGMSLGTFYLVLAVSGPTNANSNGNLITCLGPNNATATGVIPGTTRQVGYLGTFNNCQLDNLTFDGVGYAGNWLVNLGGSGHRVDGVTVINNGSPQYLAIIQFDTTTDYSGSANWVRTQIDNVLGAAGTGALPGGWGGDNRIAWQPYSQLPDLPVWDLSGNGGVTIGGFVWGQAGPRKTPPPNGLLVNGAIECSLIAAASDAAAAAAGVPLNGFYQNGGAVHIRLV